MDFAELQQRIRRGEDLHTEFKEVIPHPDDLAAALVAFANTDGGLLIVGVADDGAVAGVADCDAVMRQVDNVSRNNCEPPVTVVQETATAGAETSAAVCVAVRVAKGDQRPYRTNRGVHYVRTTTGRQQASREELLRLFQAAESLYFDDLPCRGTTLADFDTASFERFFAEAFGSPVAQAGVPFEQLLRNSRLAKGGELTLAGVLLFGRNPQAWYPYACIHAAHVHGTDLADNDLDRADLTGTLATQVRDAEGFLNARLRVTHHIEGFQPERRPELPAEALREAVVNAVSHRDYAVRAPVRLLLFDDRLEVRTPGKLPNGVDIEAMKVGIHVPRNPILLSLLAKMGHVTAIGSGIPRILKLVTQAVGRPPALEQTSAEFVLTIPRRVEGRPRQG